MLWKEPGLSSHHWIKKQVRESPRHRYSFLRSDFDTTEQIPQKELPQKVSGYGTTPPPQHTPKASNLSFQPGALHWGNWTLVLRTRVLTSLWVRASCRNFLSFTLPTCPLDKCTLNCASTFQKVIESVISQVPFPKTSVSVQDDLQAKTVYILFIDT